MATDAVDAGHQTSIEHALSVGEPLRVGWFRFYLDGERWEWSAQVERMHGYPAGTANPTTELVLSHKHPEDLGQVSDILAVMRRTGAAFSTRHRIVDTAGAVHHVVVVGDQLHDDAGAVIGTNGFYIDVTPARADADQAALSEAVAEIAEARGGIEQVKGMLMLIYRIDADAAFDLLRWRSQETNTKLRPLAEQIATEIAALDYGDVLPDRVVFDRLLLTAHLRVPPAG
ncbi:PAS and ANTAR domain-containing protein [Mycolicibacterium fallax]|uniref:Antitermination regulator n=1 Tax=Mycolicibacterium fallax TaxID=1793 RepID=A0A1X1R9J8_MYCFA|nr:PAS and ANTAR domain-containing protein [Mycolicibacterium fallax]ORV01797.1 antitermination regulator [Mycolicibacterium fallax]BBY98076.1 putative transcription antitermination regulator [Mycolicibacterium fallax]